MHIEEAFKIFKQMTKQTFVVIGALRVTDRSKTVLLLWILFVICVLCLSVILPCLFLSALWSPAEKGLTSWLYCMLCFLGRLSLSHMVSWVGCGILIVSIPDLCLLPYFKKSYPFRHILGFRAAHPSI